MPEDSASVDSGCSYAKSLVQLSDIREAVAALRPRQEADQRRTGEPAAEASLYMNYSLEGDTAVPLYTSASHCRTAYSSFQNFVASFDFSHNQVAGCPEPQSGYNQQLACALQATHGRTWSGFGRA